MPLSVNVGLNRKASHNYQSTGVSINVTAELDATLLAKPDELQQQIAGLYNQAESALERQAAQLSPAEPPRTNGARTNGSQRNYERQNGNRGYANRSARTNGNGGGYSGGGRMTDSQSRAIDAIARRVNADAAYEAREITGADLEDLTVRQASDLIDHLKSLEPTTGNGNGRR
jgi:hypothetical protein